MKGNHWYYLRNETTMVFRIRYILDQKVLELWSMIKRRSTCPTKWNINSLWKFCSRKNHIFLIFNGIKHLFFVNQILCSSPVDMSWKHVVPPSESEALVIDFVGVIHQGPTANLLEINTIHYFKLTNVDAWHYAYVYIWILN